MGRTESSYAPLAQQGYRKEQRAKQARLIINKTIPHLLASDARARGGIERAQLIVDPQLTKSANQIASSAGKSKVNSIPSSSKKKGKRNKESNHDDDIAQNSTEPHLEGNLGPQEHLSESLEVSLQISDTLVAAYGLHQQTKMQRSHKNVAVLNMASPLRPGGGVLNGATSQEESLSVRTTLLPSLREEWYRLPEVGGIWTPDVCVFQLKDEELVKGERFYVDVISAAALRFPEVIEKAQGKVSNEEADEEDMVEKVFANDTDKEAAMNKIKAVMHILHEKSTESVVLGAWGCGAYGNPVGETARIFRRVLLGKEKRSNSKNMIGKQWSHLKKVVFAIKDSKMAEDFAAAWGSDIQIEYRERKDRISGYMEDETEERNINELEQKIGELELQVAEVKTPLLKQGIESTLLMLKDQLRSSLNQRSANSKVLDEDIEINDMKHSKGED